jgi:hypothetical protein
MGKRDVDLKELAFTRLRTPATALYPSTTFATRNPIKMPSQREETPYTYHSSSSKQDDHLGSNPIKMPSQKEEMHYKYYASSCNLDTQVGSKSSNYPFTNRGDTLCLSSSSNLDDHIVSVH